jgi:hypothetical protein
VQSSTLIAAEEYGHKSLSPLPWIHINRNSPYFITDVGETWTPIGQNDAVTWPDLRGLYRRKDLPSAERYIKMLAAHGVTCLRLMLEYSQGTHHNFERPAGRFRPQMIQLWDDLFALCEQHGLRILLTPFDTYWLWVKWKRHPYNRDNGGPCADRKEVLLCRETREAIKSRFAFCIERWSGSGVLFAWDLWNEIHPSYAQDSAACFDDFIEELSLFVRRREIELHGRAHPQTVSVFGPHMVLDHRIAESIFRHPCLDFASTHFYEEGTIDFPSNTVDAAVSTARLTREALAEVRDNRPFMDSEHGPIHTYKDHRKTLPATFDDEYFRHMQWAHFCAGGAGGGMRWPNRSPHKLTPGMRIAQRNLARFLPLIDWQQFNRRNWNAEVRVSVPAMKAVACGDQQQALLWLLRSDQIGREGMLRVDAEPLTAAVTLPTLKAGTYRITSWNTAAGERVLDLEVQSTYHGGLTFTTPGVVTDMAFAIQRQ